MNDKLILWIYWDLPVRAKRGEMKGPRGCLRRSSRSPHSDMNGCKAEIRQYANIMGGYGQLAYAEVYNLSDWNENCLTAKPVRKLDAVP